MSLRLTKSLLVAALVFGSLGASFGRTFVENPAWRHVGVKAWAEFSRAADLGNGEIVYPIEGIGSALLIAAAAFSFRMSPQRPLSAAIPIYGAVLMKIGVLLITTQAAPIMLSVAHIGDDPVALQRAFDGFAQWGNVRAVFVFLGYCTEVWALVTILRLPSREPGQGGGSHQPCLSANEMREATDFNKDALTRTEATYAMMIRKGNQELQAEINRALEEIANDGTRRSLLLKWFDDGSTEVNG